MNQLFSSALVEEQHSVVSAKQRAQPYLLADTRQRISTGARTHIKRCIYNYILKQQFFFGVAPVDGEALSLIQIQHLAAHRKSPRLVFSHVDVNLLGHVPTGACLQPLALSCGKHFQSGHLLKQTAIKTLTLLGYY